MARCIYCGEPAGLFRKLHERCRSRHENAIKTIPTFFSKILGSGVPADRFGKLLTEVGAVSFIEPAEMKLLQIDGLMSVIDGALKTRLLKPSEVVRIVQIKSALGLEFRDMPDIDDKLTKVGILNDLQRAAFASRIKVIGPMPIKLAPGEEIVWIFNRVKCYRSNHRKTVIASEESEPANATAALEEPEYFLADGPTARPAPQVPKLLEGSGDLIYTNANIYFLFEGEIRKLPPSKTRVLKTFSDGIKLGSDTSQDRSRIFIVDDPWFATNLTYTIRRSEMATIAAK